MKKEDTVKLNWQRRREEAVRFGKAAVEGMLKDYQEPVRAGTRRGDLIGFSFRKKKAACLMVLHNPDPYLGLSLKEIANIAGIRYGVLLVWRTQTEFQKEEREACNSLGEAILNTIDIELTKQEIESIKASRREDGADRLTLGKLGGETFFKILKSERENPTPFVREFLAKEVKKRRIKIIEIDDSDETLLAKPYLKIKGYGGPEETIKALARHLVYLNTLVALPLINVLRKKIDDHIFGWLNVAVTLKTLSEVRDRRSFERRKALPEMKEITKVMIEGWIKQISDPAFREALGPENVQKSVEDFKAFIFQELGL